LAARTMNDVKRIEQENKRKEKDVAKKMFASNKKAKAVAAPATEVSQLNDSIPGNAQEISPESQPDQTDEPQRQARQQSLVMRLIMFALRVFTAPMDWFIYLIRYMLETAMHWAYKSYCAFIYCWNIYTFVIDLVASLVE